MRILHLTNHCRNLGNGIVNVAVDLACAQAADGHEVAFASAGGEFEALLGNAGVTHHFIDQQSRGPHAIALGMRALAKVLTEFKPDIVHGHMMTGVVLARVLQIFCGQYRLITTVHNAFQKSAILMGLGNRVIVVSRAVGDQMQRRGISPRNIRVVHNGPLHSPRLANLAIPEVTLQHPAILTVAGMYVRKGIAELIDAFARIASVEPQTHLYLVGDGPDREAFEAQVAQLKISERVHFVRHVADPRGHFRQADVFVLASHADPSPLVIPEAREAGCAIVATNVDGIPEALDGGTAGLLVNAKDATALADTIIQVLQDETLRSNLRKQAATNLDYFTVERLNRETTAVYIDALR